MGFLDRFFKPRIEKKEVKLEDLRQYTEDILKERFVNLNEKIEDIYTNIKEVKSKILEKLNSLRDAELQNKNIPTRAMQLMDGNREAYIKKIRNFF